MSLVKEAVISRIIIIQTVIYFLIHFIKIILQISSIHTLT